MWLAIGANDKTVAYSHQLTTVAKTQENYLLPYSLRFLSLMKVGTVPVSLFSQNL